MDNISSSRIESLGAGTERDGQTPTREFRKKPIRASEKKTSIDGIAEAATGNALGVDAGQDVDPSAGAGEEHQLDERA